MFGDFQFGRSQFGQPPESQAGDVTVTVDSLDALAELGAFTVSIGGRTGKPPWLPLIPADWPINKPRKFEKPIFNSVVRVWTLDATAGLSSVTVSADSGVTVRSITGYAVFGIVTVSGACEV